MKNALSFDVEDYFHVTGFEQFVDRENWDNFETRFEIGMSKILRVLDRHGVRATFFFLGWIADRYPNTVSEVAAGGHEIASHGYGHRLVYTQSPAEFEADLVKALGAVRKSYDGPILGYRAPSFSIRNDNLWALDVIRKLGFVYDSSIFPISRQRYGIVDAQDQPHEVEDGLIEFPMSTINIAGKKIPVCGGRVFSALSYGRNKMGNKTNQSKATATRNGLSPSVGI